MIRRAPNCVAVPELPGLGVIFDKAKQITNGESMHRPLRGLDDDGHAQTKQLSVACGEQS
jgi:hypothetical protein